MKNLKFQSLHTSVTLRNEESQSIIIQLSMC